MRKMEECVAAYREAAAELILAQQALVAAREALDGATQRVGDARSASDTAATMLLDLASGESA